MKLCFPMPPLLSISPLAAAAFFLLATTTAWAALVTYPVPDGIPASPRYAVELVQGGQRSESFVYWTEAQQPHAETRIPAPFGRTASYTSFDFSGEVEVVVRRLDGLPVGNCVVRPVRLGIAPVVEGNSLRFKVDRPMQLSVEMDPDIEAFESKDGAMEIVKHALLIFANPLEMNPPQPDDSGVLYFGPGVHSIGLEAGLRAGIGEVYLAGGAYVRGSFLLRSVEGVRFSGRGILAGEDASGQPLVPLVTKSIHIEGEDSANVRIEGITLVNASSYNITLEGTGHTVRNVKVICWWGQTDGSTAPADGVVEDCFFKVNDDALKLYYSNSVVRRCTIWQHETGAPFQLTWNLCGDDRRNVRVEDCDVIHTDWNHDHINRALVNCVHGGDAHIRDYLFENIRVEGRTYRFLRLELLKTKWAPKNVGWGRVSNLTFRNIFFDGPLIRPDRLRGVREGDQVYGIQDIRIENLQIAGEKILEITPERFYFDPETTSNILLLP